MTGLLAVAASGGVAAAGPAGGEVVGGQLAVTGEVVDTSAKWTSDKSAIVSDIEIRGDDGTTVTVRQLGGSVGGIGMLASHHPRLLAVGDEISVVANVAFTGSGAPSYVLRTVARAAPVSRADDEPRIARYGVSRTTKTQTPLFWTTGCIHLAYDAAGTTHIAGDAELEALDRAAAEWEAEASVCSGLAFSSAVVSEPEPGRNFINSVIFREDRWCTPATDDDPEICHDPSVIAVTRVFFVDDADSPRDGEIVEADIEFNGVDFALSLDGQTLGTAFQTADLLSTATHELGHLIGLAHNCVTGFEDPPRDHEGNLVPDCADVAAGSEIAEATMFFLQEDGDQKQASLETSDVLGGCATLTGAQCERIVSSGCAITPAGGSARDRGAPGAIFALALALLGLGARRRRGSA